MNKDQLTSFLLCIVILWTWLYIATTPIHESVHWVIDDIDPAIDPKEMHLFDSFALSNNDFGCVISLQKKGMTPMIDGTTHEILAYGIQNIIIFTIIYCVMLRHYRTIQIKEINEQLQKTTHPYLGRRYIYG